MTELTREQIERVFHLSQHGQGAITAIDGVPMVDLCRMALRTHDEEQRSERYRLRLEALDPDRIEQRAQRSEDSACLQRLRDGIRALAHELDTGEVVTGEDEIHQRLSVRLRALLDGE